MLLFHYKNTELSQEQAIGFLVHDAKEKRYDSRDIYKAIRHAAFKLQLNGEDPIEFLQGITHGLEITYSE